MSKKLILTAITLVATLGLVSAAHADHSWGDYHWARTTSSFDLQVINSTTSDWDPYVSAAVADWSQSGVLNMVEDASGSTSKKVRRQCNAPDGMVRICNLAYGNTGWLGIAGISIDSNNHIISGYTKMNDTYFDDPYYSGADWKQSVTCQELGHDVGLGHQDENFNNESLFSCMDYQDPPYEYPNAHDYEQLETIYGHTDSYDSYATSGGDDGGDDGGGNGCNAPPGKGCNKGSTANSNSQFGLLMAHEGQHSWFLRIDEDGTQHWTHVYWAEGFGPEGHH